MENTEENGDLDSVHPTCPICMHEVEDVVHGPCRHGFCLPCLERFLLSPSSASSSFGSTTVATPTLGSCPMCRQELYLFDIEYAKTGEKVHARSLGQGTFPDELAGAIFLESTQDHPGSVGRGSFHFPVDTMEAPYYDISKIPRGTNRPGHDVIRFVDYHWHEPSRTFAGILPCPKPSLLDHFHVILSFSPDWRFVRQGAHVKRRRRNFDTVKDIQLAYFFDGDWTVVKTSSSWEDSFPVNKSFHVQGFAITESLFLNPCMIRPPDKDDESSQPTLVFLSSFQELEPSPAHNNINLEKDIIPMGYEWTWVDPKDTSSNRHSMTWRRESISSTVPPDQINRLGGNSGRLLLRSTKNEHDAYLAAQRQRTIPQYNPHSVWGNVFCQGLKVGLASYHFEPETTGDSDSNDEQQHRVYISYENPATGQWPPLDNGQAIPARVPFHNISFDPDTRTFRGTICWQEDYGTSWQGMIRWEYEMIFDRDYTCIIGGRVLSYTLHSTEDGEEMSRYGAELIYCNAKLWEIYRAQAESEDGENDDDGQRYRERSGLWRVGLQGQGASVRLISMLHAVLVMAQAPGGQTMIDYNL